MATITIDTGNAAQTNRIVDAFCAVYNYQTNIPDGSGGMIPNPETKNQFAKRMLARYVKDVVKGFEANIAAEAARVTAADAVEALPIT